MNQREHAEVVVRVEALEKHVDAVDLQLAQLALLADIEMRVRALELAPGPDAFGVENKLSINAEGKTE